MMLSKIIPNYILINGIAIGGTVFVILLVYRKLSSSFPKRLTAYFERFYCGDRARSTPQSSGLGLAIVKRIVELHGVRSMHRCRDRNCPFICFSDRRNLPCNRINLLHGSYSFSVYLAFVISFIILLLIPEDIYLSVLSPSCALLRKRLLPLSPFWQYIPPLYPYRPL